jgi:hypothetical protein
MKKKTKPTPPRITWERKPQTQVVPNKKAYTRKEKHIGKGEL